MLYKINKCKKMNGKLKKMKVLNMNISKIIQKEYRKRYYYSINYYNISKINPLFSSISDSEIKSHIYCKFKELKYECDKNEYLLPIFYKLSVLRNILKLIIINNLNNSLNNICPNYSSIGRQYYYLMNKYIISKANYYKKIQNKEISNEIKSIVFNDIKNTDNSIAALINEDDDNKDESKDKNDSKLKDKVENREDTEINSLLLLIERMTKKKEKNKYNKIKELFLESEKKIGNSIFKNNKKKLFLKQNSLQELSLFSFKRRISIFKKNKNNMKLIREENNKFYNSLDKEKYNKYCIPTKKFISAFKEKRQKMENFFNIWNNCHLNINCDKKINKNKNSINIKGNNIQIKTKQNNFKKFRSFFAKKCQKELGYDEVNYNGSLSKNKKFVNNVMIKKIGKFTNRNLYNLKLQSFNHNKIKSPNLICNNKKYKIKSLSKGLSLNMSNDNNSNFLRKKEKCIIRNFSSSNLIKYK